METPYQILTRLNISTTSYIRAALTLGEWELRPVEFYINEISNILGSRIDKSFDSPKVAHLYFGYYVQELVRVMKTGAIPDVEFLWDVAQKCAEKFIQEYPYSTCEYKHEAAERESWKVTAEQLFKTMKREGASKKDIVDELCAKTDLSQPTIQAFFKEMKNVHGFEVELKQKLLNVEDIDKLYRDSMDLCRSDILIAFKDRFNMSDASALSHFYRCKKSFGNCKETVKTAVSVETSKDKVFKALDRIKTKKELLKRNEVCGKISSQLSISDSSVKTYYYQYLKSKQIELPKEK